MKKFTIDCDLGGVMTPFDIYIGKPEGQHHPLHFQAEWLSSAKNGLIPGNIMTAVEKLNALSKESNTPLIDLYVYAFGTEEEKSALEKQTLESFGHDEEDEEDEARDMIER